MHRNPDTDGENIQKIVSLLTRSHPDEINERFASDLISTYGTDLLLNVLNQLITREDIHNDVVSNAMRLLLLVDRPLLVKVTLSLLGDAGSEVRRGACYFVGQFALVECRSLIEQLVLDDHDAEVRYWATAALGEIGDATSLKILEEAMTDTEQTELYGSVGSAAQQAIQNLSRRIS